MVYHWLTRFDNVVNDVFVIVSNIIQVQIVYSYSQTANLTHATVQMAENLEHTAFGGTGTGDSSKDKHQIPFQFRAPESPAPRTQETVSSKHESAFDRNVSGSYNAPGCSHQHSNNAEYSSSWALHNNRDGIHANDPVYSKLAEEISYLTALVLEEKKIG